MRHKRLARSFILLVQTYLFVILYNAQLSQASVCCLRVARLKKKQLQVQRLILRQRLDCCWKGGVRIEYRFRSMDRAQRGPRHWSSALHLRSPYSFFQWHGCFCIPTACCVLTGTLGHSNNSFNQGRSLKKDHGSTSKQERGKESSTALEAQDSRKKAVQLLVRY